MEKISTLEDGRGLYAIDDTELDIIQQAYAAQVRRWMKQTRKVARETVKWLEEITAEWDKGGK